MYLDKATFTKVIDSTPLISIDLIVKNSEGQVLLGLRNNKPAQGFWFVPGGRVLKGESLDGAFQRLCADELGIKLTRDQADFMGPFEHFYEDYVFGDDVATHYVVLAYQLSLDVAVDALPKQQHNCYQWWHCKDMANSELVHEHSKWYLL